MFDVKIAPDGASVLFAPVSQLGSILVLGGRFLLVYKLSSGFVANMAAGYYKRSSYGTRSRYSGKSSYSGRLGVRYNRYRSKPYRYRSGRVGGGYRKSSYSGYSRVPYRKRNTYRRSATTGGVAVEDAVVKAVVRTVKPAEVSGTPCPSVQS